MSADQQVWKAFGCTWSFRPKAEIQLRMATHFFRRKAFKPETRNCGESWALIYFITPGLRLKIGAPEREWFDAEPFTGYLIPPATPFWEQEVSFGNTVIENVGIAFCVNEQVGLEAFLHSGKGYVVLYDPARTLKERLLRMCELGSSGANEVHWRVFGELSMVIAAMHDARRVSDGVLEIRSTAITQVSDFVSRVQEYLSANIEKPISMARLARDMNVSRSKLSHRYKEETGESPHQSHNRFRVEKVKRLLQEGGSVKSAAAAVGFSDAFHMSKVFRRIEGMPPSRFVRTLRAG